jgi:Mg-chelatase subunit ChlD
MIAMINDLHSNDEFAIIKFESSVYKWNATFQNANNNDIKTEAIAYVRSLADMGGTWFLECKNVAGTDINSAMLAAIEMQNTAEITNKTPMIVFLTDGQANGPVSDPKMMLENMKV